MFRNKNGVRGIWFGKPEDQQNIFDILNNPDKIQNGYKPAKSQKLNLILKRNEMKKLLLDLVEDDEFIDILHKKYLTNITR